MPFEAKSKLKPIPAIPAIPAGKRLNTTAARAEVEGKVQGPAMRVARLRADEPWRVPTKAFEADAGWDLSVSRWTTIYPGARALISHNLAMSLPEGFFGLILPRSSTFHQKGLIVHPGIVDSGFRDEVMTIAYNPTTRNVYVGEGERISQILVLPVLSLKLVDVRDAAKLPAGERGKRGFGSTGGFGLGPDPEPADG